MQQSASEIARGSWPAFYESSPGNILWIDSSGTVVNGAWRPKFSQDRLTCWHTPDHVFRWVGSAPHDGNYNDVIDAFRNQRESGKNAKAEGV